MKHKSKVTTTVKCAEESFILMKARNIGEKSVKKSEATIVPSNNLSFGFGK